MNRKLLLRFVVNTFSHTFAATIQLLVHGFEGKLAAYRHIRSSFPLSLRFLPLPLLLPRQTIRPEEERRRIPVWFRLVEKKGERTLDNRFHDSKIGG